MTKEAFLTRLRDSMAARKIDRENMDKYLRRFSRILDNTPPREVEQKIAEFGDPNHIADRIVGILAGEQGGSGAAKATAAQSEHPKPTAPATPGNKSRVNGSATTQRQPQPGRPVPPQPGNRGGESVQVDRRRTAPEPRRETSDHGKKVFAWTAILTSPIWLFLVCALGALFLCGYTVIFLLAAVLIIAEVAIVVGGVLLAVIGIVYGVMKILPGEAVYIGLYELGLGIRNGGVVMLIAILIYNFVVNMVPLALKSLTKLLKWTVGRLKELVVRLRKECDR